ncbi:LysR family transcriptional regulator [Pseudoalteromonas obscura]|uniref:LysR family transcriptional regulator n=1 Tax=Pseudoalteromonas obscura TaxID=3048491 RepID=A0ABT7END4_9GAMM|nr:LysR family transcriptional regulator [Pseudoalteromonas sp. P94(2023)]MDK2596561.1 LysR family transcriptional regulator [Pseudoalteromonas sp. P94(2023)]
MEIADLHKFLVIAQQQSLQKAAQLLDTSPSALSKSLKRLESSLQVKLFDRVGKSLRLNEHGAMLQPRAVALTNLAEDTKAQLKQGSKAINCVVAAPSILQFKWASVLARQSNTNKHITLTFDTQYESNALHKLLAGEVDLAIVTGEVVKNLPNDIQLTELGKLTMQIAMGQSHPLRKQTSTSLKQLVNYSFAAPDTSPFCGEQRGVGCDGWLAPNIARNIKWVVNDYAVLGQLVKSGLALAYLPDYIVREWQLFELPKCSENLEYTEHVYILSHKSAPRWLSQLLQDLRTD